MSAFGGLFITNVGRALQLKAQTGVQLNFTRMAVGNGELGSNIIADLRDMKNEIKSLSIDRLQVLTDNKAIVSSTLSNQNLQSGFYFREVGVFAEDPDEGEILYCYGNAGDNAEYIPGGGGADVIEKIIEILTIIGNAENVTATIDESLAYVTVNRYENEQGTITLETVADQVRPAINELNETVVSMSSFTKDGFQNFVVGGEPQGGVKRIWYDDPAIEYSGNVIYGNKERLLFIGSKAKLTFVGTNIHLSTYISPDLRTIEVSIDGGAVQTISWQTDTWDGTRQNYLLKLVAGLTNTEHSIEIAPTAQGVNIYRFEIIQTADQTTKNNVGTSYIDAVKADITAGTQSYTTPSQGRCDLLVVDKQGATSVVEGTDGQNEKAFRVEEDGAISREYVENIPEWLKNRVNVWNSGVTGDYNTGWRSSNKVSYSNQFHVYSKLTGASFSVGFIGTGLDLITLTDKGQGILGVSIDGSAETTYDLYNTQVNEQYLLNVASGLPFGYHEVKFRITGTKNASSSDTKINIDAFDIYLPATPDLPADTQPLAKVYPMPEPATMASVPARPTSQEEKGWIRYESEEGSHYVGSGWEKIDAYPRSGGNHFITNVTDDFMGFNFIGDAIRLISRISSDQGIGEVYIDDIFEASIDFYNPSVANKIVVFEKTGLSFEKHNIRVECKGTTNHTNTYISIDAFEVHRPLYLTDIRNLSPVKEKNLYEIDFNSRLTEPLASGKLGEVIDRLFKMDNVIHISNDNGEAYLYPDGRAECFICDYQSNMPGGQVVFIINHHPIVFSRVDTRQLSVLDDTPQYFDVGMHNTNTNNSKTEIRVENLHTGTIGVSWYLEVKGRWY